MKSDNSASPTSSQGMCVHPCLRWAGGKQRHLKYLQPLVPPHFESYFEPMVGAAALFLNLQPKKATLGDSNVDLMNFYEVLRDKAERLFVQLESMEPSKEKYYEVRVDEPTSPVGKAARFLFLNRLAWNGLYRVNSQGKFNVPCGSRIPKAMWDFDNLRAVADRLQSVSLFSGDFKECTRTVSEGDFVFFDPPYPRGATSGMGFNKYTTKRFSFDDHKKLADLANELAASGVFVLIAETAHAEVADLFPKSFNRVLVEEKVLIAGKASARKRARELLLFNYNIME